MPVTVIISIGLLALVLLQIGRGVRVTNPGTADVVDRMGRFHSVRMPGISYLVPFIDRARTVYLIEQQSTVRLAAVTEDGVPVLVDATLQRQVVDPRLAVHAVSNYVVAVDHLFRRACVPC